MSRVYWEEELFPQFLSSVDSCTLSDLATYEIQNQLGNLAKKAIADFKFPKVDLTYSYDETQNPDTTEDYGYYFEESEIAQTEYNIIFARMKQFWVEYQLSQERLFYNAYYDKDVRLHSPGNTIHNLVKLKNSFKNEADRIEYNYYRKDSEGNTVWGSINE